MAHKTENNILESSATLGTGDLALAGAVPSYQTFASKMAVGDTCHYYIAEVDIVGRPTGKREWGKGTFKAGNALERTSVYGPVVGTKVDFTSTSKLVGLSILAPNADTQADWRTLLGVNNVDNTPDADKPISDATQDALDLKSDTVTTVLKDSGTGAAALPVGTNAQRPANGSGKLRFNSDTGRFEGNNGAAWGSLGGATGGGNDAVFYLNDAEVSNDYTVPAGKNAMSAGPITINPGASVTVGDGSVWTVV